MKIKVISRSEEDHTKEVSTDARKLQRNLDPLMHPFERPREYVRALNAVKLDKVFAKPFITSLHGHTDGIFTMIRHPTQVNCFASGSCDGVIKLWNLSTMNERTTIQSHDGFVRGICFTNNGRSIISCGEDQTIKMWNLTLPEYESEQDVASIFKGKSSFTSIDHQLNSTTFATSSVNVEVWDHNRSTPLQSLSWGHASVTKVRFNPIEYHLLSACTSDREIILYDIRESTPAQKLITKMRTNATAWNPREAYMIALANEDENCYQYDIRNLKKAVCVYRDHVGSVLDIDFSPTGTEFVTGSYDKTIRIFPVESYSSREVYFTNRMQRIFSVLYTADSKFIMSGSDDMNIRVWKSKASGALGIKSAREKEKLEYQDKLKEKFKEIPQIKTIAQHRRVPKAIYKKRYLKNVMHNSQQRKIKNEGKTPSKKKSVAEKKKLLQEANVVVEK
ncbi:hypothetical protein PPL_05834 [Heterostelium album PN500]|uniref:DDB1- and CUL4-associated factor 13 n=1 Tax=Heterostelium pallidum (strain ATCC 26659 / Pp 5 / PN500) TaxID=670386 RepID=D3BBG6_HETP5|nr:hypothetical protein PPL_05834 [Heterostelium album PN500]EFA80999.1 hypothetical protein PPL_05834 [Heterostelium album PN500]|eukprot:XP_020433117.1 hypothetical protein PPL_05834 [Heterostelium album PN500]